MSSVSTSGWDVVSVVNIDTMNKIISDDQKYPEDFSGQVTVIGQKVLVSGQWQTWGLTNKVGGRYISLRCLIKSGTVTISNQCYNINSDDNLSYIDVQVSLDGFSDDPNNWIGNDPTSIITEKTECYKLMISRQNMITVLDSKYTNEEIYIEGIDVALDSVMKNWFNDNVDDFEQIFSVILIGLEADKGDFQWLKPSAYSYAADSNIKGDLTAFGALTLVDGATNIGEKEQSVDINALELVKPLGANSALVISKEKFVEHFLLPSAVDLVKSSTPNDFTISDTGLSLTNNKEMVWQDFQGDDDTISPILPKESFTLTLQSDFIHISIVGAHYRPNDMSTVYMNLEQNFKYKVEYNGNNEPVFVPDENGMGDANIDCQVVIDDWAKWLELAMGIITSIAGVLTLGTGLADAVAAGAVETMAEEEAETMVSFSFKLAGREVNLNSLAPIAASIQEGVVSNPTIFSVVKIGSRVTLALTSITLGATMIAGAIYQNEYQDVPSFKYFAENLTGAIKWPTIDNIELKSATLADCFVIGLNLS